MRPQPRYRRKGASKKLILSAPRKKRRADHLKAYWKERREREKKEQPGEKYCEESLVHPDSNSEVIIKQELIDVEPEETYFCDDAFSGTSSKSLFDINLVPKSEYSHALANHYDTPQMSIKETHSSKIPSCSADVEQFCGTASASPVSHSTFSDAPAIHQGKPQSVDRACQTQSKDQRNQSTSTESTGHSNYAEYFAISTSNRLYSPAANQPFEKDCPVTISNFDCAKTLMTYSDTALLSTNNCPAEMKTQPCENNSTNYYGPPPVPFTSNNKSSLPYDSTFATCMVCPDQRRFSSELRNNMSQAAIRCECRHRNNNSFMHPYPPTVRYVAETLQFRGRLPYHSVFPASEPCMLMNSDGVEASYYDLTNGEKRNIQDNPKITERESTTSKSDRRQKDKFDAYAEYLAGELRNIDFDKCALIQKAIGDLIFEAKTGKRLS